MNCTNYPSLNAKQKKLLKEEAKRQAREYYTDISEKFAKEIDAAIIYTLRTVFGFGEKRLKQAYFGLFELHNQLKEQFQAESNEEINFVYSNRLKDLGFDLELWDEELSARLEGEMIRDN